MRVFIMQVSIGAIIFVHAKSRTYIYICACVLQVDVWSAGVIFYQMLYGKRPFGDNLSQQSIIHQRTILNAHEVQFPQRPAVSDETKVITTVCMHISLCSYAECTFFGNAVIIVRCFNNFKM